MVAIGLASSKKQSVTSHQKLLNRNEFGFRDPRTVQGEERYRGRIPRSQTWDRLETGQMHIGGCHQRAHTDIFPVVVLFACPIRVLTYSYDRGWRAEEACFQQLQAYRSTSLVRKSIFSDAEGTRTNHVGRFLTLSENADWACKENNDQRKPGQYLT